MRKKRSLWKWRSKQVPEGRRWNWWLAPKAFDWVTSSLYLGILVISYVKLNLSCPCDLHTRALWLTVAITSASLLLLAIDRGEYLWYGEESPARVAAVLLVLRILLIESIVQLERLYAFPLNYASMLYLIPPYLATLSFGHRTGIATAFLAGIVYIGQEMLYSLHWYTNLVNLWMATLFCFALVFLLAMARVVWLEKASRMHAEQLLQEVERSHRQLTIYAGQVAELATLKERNRIARDIHDGLGHALIAINVQLEKALVYYERSPQEAVQAIGAARQVARGALQEVRSSVRALRANQEDFSCSESIALLVQQLRTSQLLVNYSSEGNEAVFPQEIRLTLYRVAQESFTNIQKHAHAREVQVALRFVEQEACLRISDNGQGFEPERVQQELAKSGGGYGLAGMRERVALVHGHFSLESAPGQGTLVQVVLPQAGLAAQIEKRSVGGECEQYDEA